MPEHLSRPPEQHIRYDSLTPEVRSYADNLLAQARELLLKYGVTATDLKEATTALATKARENPKASLPDLHRFNDLLTALTTIQTTGDLPPEAREAKSGIPYERWSETINPLFRESLTSGKSPELRTAFPGIESSPDPIEFLLQSQQDFYRSAYNDPAFTFDRSKLRLPKERLNDIQSAIERGEVDYPLIVVPPDRRILRREERSDPALSARSRTLHRVLFDRLIREKGIKVWERTDDLNTFLDQVRDFTLGDLTRTDLLDSDGKPLRFEAIAGKPNTEQPWFAYLRALYPTLPRHEATTATQTIGFVKWEGDPPNDRAIPGTTKTIANKSQLNAVRLRYPLATPSQWLTLFAQYHAKTGEPLDQSTWSRLFGIVNPATASAGPSVDAIWGVDGLGLHRNHPGYADSLSRLRSSR